MTGKRILILSSHELFREGLKRILDEIGEPVVSDPVDSFPAAEELLQSQQIDAVIIDRTDERLDADSAVSRLLAYPGLRVITVKLDSGDLWIYRQERVLEASVKDLVAALTN